MMATPSTVNDIYSSILSLFSRDNITLAIALLGAFGTLRGFYQNRFSVRLTYRSQLVQPSFKVGIIWFDFLIENLSNFPVSISRIFISINDNTYEVLHEKYRVHSLTENFSGSKEVFSVYTIPLPVKLEGLGSIGGYFQLRMPQYLAEENFLKSSVVVTLYTNRGKKSFTIYPKESTLDPLTGTGFHPYHN